MCVQLAPKSSIDQSWDYKGAPVARLLQQLWNDEQGQDIAEYAVMLAVILVIVVGTIRLIGSNANNVFSQVGSAIQ
jgi:Flp pilus assembly pilin Flp